MATPTATPRWYKCFMAASVTAVFVGLSSILFSGVFQSYFLMPVACGMLVAAMAFILPVAVAEILN